MYCSSIRWHRWQGLGTPLVENRNHWHTPAPRARYCATDNPGLPDVRVNRIAGHAAPRRHQAGDPAVLPPTRQEYIDALAEPLRKRDLTLWSWVMPTLTRPSLQPISSIACSRAHGSKSQFGVGHWPGSNNPNGSRTRRPILRERVGELAEA